MSARDLTQDSVSRSLFRLTAPMMIRVSSNIIVSMLEIAFIGQNWGANRPERVAEGLRVTYRFCIVWGIVAALPMIFFARTIAGWIDDSAMVIDTAAFYLAAVPWSYGLWGILMMTSASLNALGKPIPSTILSFTRMFILYIPLALLLNAQFGYQGIFIATAISRFLWFLRALCAAC